MGKVFLIGERHIQEGAHYRKKQLEKDQKRFSKPFSGYSNHKKSTKSFRPPPPPKSYPAAPIYTKGMGSAFYQTREWRTLRFQVLRENGAICGLCNQSRATGHVMHVDHIKPRAAYPELELNRANLQVLCEDCNLGKGASTFKA